MPAHNSKAKVSKSKKPQPQSQPKPKILEVNCAAGCGSTCHPDENVRGYCSRDCMMYIYRAEDHY